MADDDPVTADHGRVDDQQTGALDGETSGSRRTDESHPST